MFGSFLTRVIRVSTCRASDPCHLFHSRPSQQRTSTRSFMNFNDPGIVAQLRTSWRLRDALPLLLVATRSELEDRPSYQETLPRSSELRQTPMRQKPPDGLGRADLGTSPNGTASRPSGSLSADAANARRNRLVMCHRGRASLIDVVAHTQRHPPRLARTRAQRGAVLVLVMGFARNRSWRPSWYPD